MDDRDLKTHPLETVVADNLRLKEETPGFADSWPKRDHDPGAAEERLVTGNRARYARRRCKRALYQGRQGRPIPRFVPRQRGCRRGAHAVQERRLGLCSSLDPRLGGGSVRGCRRPEKGQPQDQETIGSDRRCAPTAPGRQANHWRVPLLLDETCWFLAVDFHKKSCRRTPRHS